MGGLPIHCPKLSFAGKGLSVSKSLSGNKEDSGFTEMYGPQETTIGLLTTTQEAYKQKQL
jgi:hypothetical protein